MNKNGNIIEKRVNSILKTMTVLTMLLGAFMYNGFYCHASVNFAENAGNWLLEQLFWIGLVALAIALLGCLLKKNYVGAGITAVVGGIILYFVYNPKAIYAIGEKLSAILTNGI